MHFNLTILHKERAASLFTLVMLLPNMDAFEKYSITLQFYKDAHFLLFFGS